MEFSNNNSQVIEGFNLMPSASILNDIPESLVDINFSPNVIVQNKSEDFINCDALLSNFCNLRLKEKRVIEKHFLELVESNIDEASELYFKYIELFDKDPKLKDCKEEFELAYKGDLNQIKNEKLLPKKIEQLESSIRSFQTLKENQQKEFAQLFNEMCELNSKEGYEFYQRNEDYIEGNPKLKSIKELNWDILKQHIKPFVIPKTFTFLEKIKNIKIYKKQSDYISRSNQHSIRNLIVVGETGSGKSTLLNSMTTYLLGIKQYDTVRVKSIIENTELSQSHSQTTSVNDYIIKPDPKIFPYPIRIIDTPGFGDTRGIEYDHKNAQQIWDYIKATNIDLHGICFVMKATTNRMTCIQHYIIMQILGLFGNDVKDNFIGMITFADNQIPLAMTAIRDAQVPVKETNTFKFNNSAFFPGKTIDDDPLMGRLYWEMGVYNFKNFFNQLVSITPVSLTKTKEVIRARECLEARTKAIQEQINEGIIERKNLEKLVDVKNSKF